MADPRFFDNRGPLPLAELCAAANVAVPPGADSAAKLRDVAGLAEAGPAHLTFFSHPRACEAFAATKAGWCLVAEGKPPRVAPKGTILIPVPSVIHAYAAMAARFYPTHELDIRAQKTHVHSTAIVDETAVLAPGVVIGPNAEIGAGTRIGANVVIGRGVCIGRHCEIGANSTIAFAYVGDHVVVQSGAHIGGSGFGFASSAAGHVKVPQLGRVIVQDRAEIGSNTAIDRGALSDTVIGEGAKIDNLVQIGHNTVIGRHTVIAGQAGISGSVTLGDFVVLGGGVGISDHVTVGAGARVAGMSGIAKDLQGGRDYGGAPAKPVREWHREHLALTRLAKKSGSETDD